MQESTQQNKSANQSPHQTQPSTTETKEKNDASKETRDNTIELPSMKETRGALFDRIKKLAKGSSIVRPLRTLESDTMRALRGPGQEKVDSVAEEKDSGEEAVAEQQKASTPDTMPPAEIIEEAATLEPVTETPEALPIEQPLVKEKPGQPIALEELGQEKPYESQLFVRQPEAMQDTAVPPSPLRTLRHDVAETIKEEGLSKVRIAAKERERRSKRGEPIVTSQPSSASRRLPIVIASVVLILAGLSSAGYVYYISLRNAPLPAEMQTQSLVFTDRISYLLVSGASSALRTQLLQKLEDTRTTEGSIHEIALISDEETRERLTTDEFLGTAGIPLPDRLRRSLGDQFVIGVHGHSEKGRFILLTSDFFANSFAGMLNWEKSIATDLGFIFPSTKNTRGNKMFHDVVIENQDVRMLRDQNGAPVLLYGFPNQETIVITDDRETFLELYHRMTTSRRVTQ